MHKGFDSTLDSQTPIVTHGGVFDCEPTCFHPTQDPISSTDGSTHAVSTGSGGGCATHAVCVTGQRSHALTTRAAACEEDGTGRGTPITTAICFTAKDSGGDAASDMAPTMRAMHHVDGNANAGGQLAVAIPINSDADRSNSAALTPPPDAEGRIRLRDPRIGVGNDGDPMFTMQSTKPHAVAFKPSHYTRGKDGAPSEVVAPLSADADKGDQDTVVAFTHSGYSNKPAWITGDRTDCLPSAGHSDGSHQGIGVICQKGECDDRARPRSDCAAGASDGDCGGSRSNDKHCCAPVAYRVHSNNSTAMRGNGISRVADEASVARSLDTCGGYAASQGGNVVAFRENQRAEVEYVDPPHALASGGGKPGQGYCGVQLGMQVRRLTPKECSFLQGFPADYLDITFRKKPAADGPKYRALGNSMAVPCMWWLGYRIAKATRRDNP